jgi:hypothetical protein
MRFEDSYNYQLIEEILKEDHIYNGFNRFNPIPKESFYINPNTDKRFFIGFENEKPVGLIIFDEPKSRTKAHFAVTSAGRQLDKPGKIMAEGIKQLIQRYPVIKALTGHISITNDRNLKFYGSNGARIISYTDDDKMFQMELRVK